VILSGVDSNDIAFVLLVICIGLLVAYLVEPAADRPRE
jgi:hypothetical protein